MLNGAAPVSDRRDQVARADGAVEQGEARQRAAGLVAHIGQFAVQGSVAGSAIVGDFLQRRETRSPRPARRRRAGRRAARPSRLAPAPARRARPLRLARAGVHRPAAWRDVALERARRRRSSSPLSRCPRHRRSGCAAARRSARQGVRSPDPSGQRVHVLGRVGERGLDARARLGRALLDAHSTASLTPRAPGGGG